MTGSVPGAAASSRSDGAGGSDADGGFGDSTRCVRAGLPDPVPGEPLLPGPVFAAPYHLDPDGFVKGATGYGRDHNATIDRLEEAIGGLEGGLCLVFASGMAAISAVVLAGLEPGDTVLLPSDGYYQTRTLAKAALAPRGVTVRLVPTAGPYPDLSGVRMVLLETPANPGLDVCDIAALCSSAHGASAHGVSAHGASALGASAHGASAHGASADGASVHRASVHRAGTTVVVDNTTATPLGQQPLSLGADLVVASGTKALTGHSDVLLGYVATRDSDTLDRLREWRSLTGAVPGPFEAWLAHRSLGTLALRLARQSANAAAVASLLAARPEVTGLRWPGLPGDPAYDVASRQLRRIPGVVTFQLDSAARVSRFLRAARLVYAATSFGGLHTTADRREQWGDPVPPGLVRLSCGCEDTADLLADLTAALDAAHA